MSNADKTLPRDVFFYLLSIISLVASAVSLGVLLFQYINIYFPDVISDPYFSPSNYYGTVHSALAALIVFFPVYFWVSIFLKRDLTANPEKRELKIRKWLLYLTLFIAGLAIIGDLIALVYNFLEGELTTRFILKIFSILVIAGSAFYYYTNELKDNQKKSGGMMMFVWGAVAFVIGVVAAGFVIAGSPQSQRLVRFDERRVNDLQLIQGQIVTYWQNNNVLPQNLDQLRNDIYGISIPVDPKTGQVYEYQVVNDLEFKLCANFETSTSSKDSRFYKPSAMPIVGYPFKNETWDHGKSPTCFERNIDTQLIKPLNTPPIKYKL